jgi:hypothetical protein
VLNFTLDLMPFTLIMSAFIAASSWLYADCGKGNAIRFVGLDVAMRSPTLHINLICA